MTFQWSAGANVSAYWLHITRTTAGDLFNGPVSGTSFTFTKMPMDGSAISVTLQSEIGSTWYSAPDVRYIAALVSPGVITSPANNSTLPGSTVTFQWTPGTNVSAY